jgi:L-ascorbate metabolism protein UlaG (beta-lactamase superfamily)
MRITKFGHACLLIEEGEARLLIDPGAFSSGFEQLDKLDAILITHQHQDHYLPENIKALMERNPAAMVYADEGSAELIAKQGLSVQAVHDGDEVNVAGVKVEVYGAGHAVIHSDLPLIPANVGYRIAERFFYPGDNFTVPPAPVEVLAAPAGAPWLKVSELVDYVRTVKPKVAIPVHDAVLAMPEMHVGILARLNPEVEVRTVANGQSTEV